VCSRDFVEDLRRPNEERVCDFIYVSDLNGSRKFYSEVLGLGVKQEMPYLAVLDHEGVEVVCATLRKEARSIRR